MWHGRLDLTQLNAALTDKSQAFDFRKREDYERAYLPGTIGIPANNSSFATSVGWLVDYATKVYIIVPELDQIDSVLKTLRRHGFDNVASLADGVEVWSCALPTEACSASACDIRFGDEHA